MNLINRVYSARRQIMKGAFSVATAMLPAISFAAFKVDFISGIGCDVLNWLKSDLSILILFLMVITIIIGGMISRMDWTRILVVIVLYGLLHGVVAIFAGQVNAPSCFN